jgi:hypothetical protein
MKVDASGNAYFSGSTTSDLGYIGGTGEEEGESVALDGSGYVFIAGYADSADGTFPAVNGPDLTENDAIPTTGDAFIARMNPTLIELRPTDGRVTRRAR